MNQRARKRAARSQQPHLRLHFLGANKTVTGSLHFLEYTEGERTVRFFIDMGLNQENDGMNRQNRLPRGLKAQDIDFGIFTHAHIDHVGYFPKLVKDGFKGPAYATAASCELMAVLLPDSGHIQEQEAGKRQERAQRRQKQLATANSKTPVPDTPLKLQGALYTEADARASLSHLQTVEFNKSFSPAQGITVRMLRASHLLGAAVVLIEIGSGAKKKRICFSGDIGRPGMPIIKDMEYVQKADYVVCEGTYGARMHEKRDRLKALQALINDAYKRALQPGKGGCGVILMPAFAIGRVQSVLFDLRQLMQEKRIPSIPVFVDSPMAIRATEIHRKHSDLHNARTVKAALEGDPFRTPEYAELLTLNESLRLDEAAAKPVIILSSSGMAQGGRVVRHLQRRLPDSKSTVVFVGFQAEGTLGRKVLGPTSEQRIAGKTVKARATVAHMPDYSGHGDQGDILNWLKKFDPKPKKVFLVHGDESSLETLKSEIETKLRFDVEIPDYRDCLELI